MTSQGIKYNKKIATKLSKEEHIILVYRHYERIRSICNFTKKYNQYYTFIFLH